MTVELFELFGVSFLLVTLLMSLIWGAYCYTQNVEVAAIGWALGFVIIGWACAFFGDGDFSKRLILMSLITIWGGRLAWHFYSKFDAKKEDPRYKTMRDLLGEEWVDFKIYVFFLFQGFLMILLSLPFIIVCGYSEQPWQFYEAIGIVLWVVGFLGEFLADRQLAEFKRNPAHEGKFCDQGLWRLARHPNYFFEWLIWCGYYFLALATSGGPFAILSPVIMLILLTWFSRIPPLETVHKVRSDE